MEALCN